MSYVPRKRDQQDRKQRFVFGEFITRDWDLHRNGGAGATWRHRGTGNQVTLGHHPKNSYNASQWAALMRARLNALAPVAGSLRGQNVEHYDPNHEWAAGGYKVVELGGGWIAHPSYSHTVNRTPEFFLNEMRAHPGRITGPIDQEEAVKSLVEHETDRQALLSPSARPQEAGPASSSGKPMPWLWILVGLTVLFGAVFLVIKGVRA